MKRIIIPSLAGLALLAGAATATASPQDRCKGDYCSPTTSTEPDTTVPDTSSSTSTSTSTSTTSTTTTVPDTTTTTTTTTTEITDPPTTTQPPTPHLALYDERCGGAITVTSSHKREVVVNPIGYHFIASSAPATLMLPPGVYTITGDGISAIFDIEACPVVTNPPTTTPTTAPPVTTTQPALPVGGPTPLPTAPPAPADPLLPETR